MVAYDVYMSQESNAVSFFWIPSLISPSPISPHCLFVVVFSNFGDFGIEFRALHIVHKCFNKQVCY